jgi:predicted ATPase
LLRQVLTPYLDGLEERMDGLETGRQAIAGYVDTINSFFTGKTIDFSPSRGVAIVDSDSGDDLSPADLSSGEKQILVLFSDVVARRDRTRLFLVDEPELSLNPNWQRKLMSSFLASTAGSAMQLVAATHSIEIMSKHRGRLVPLMAEI